MVFSDYDNDGWMDMIIAGEWMPITFLHNEKGKFVNANAVTGISNTTGWWNSIAAGDFDNDGDIDYIVGNAGLNSFYRATAEHPVNIYAKDFDGNGSYDAIPSLYLLNNLTPAASWAEFPAYGRDDMIKQILGTRRSFQNYKSYAMATMDSILPQDKRKGAVHLAANDMASAYIQNDGKGHFTIKALPMQAQLSALNGMVVDDFDGDGNLDVAFNTNDYSPDPVVGRSDALNGLVLKGDGKGGFIPLSILQSGIFINGNGKALGKAMAADNSYLLIATQNRGPMQVYKNKHTGKMIRAEKNDVFAVTTLANGQHQKTEWYYGASFLSQGSRFFMIPENAVSCIITDAMGKERNVWKKN